MRNQFLAILVAATAIVSSAAGASRPNEPHSSGAAPFVPPAVSYTESMTEDDAARLQQERVAACVVKARRGMVLKALQRDPWEPAARHMLENALDAKCLDNIQMVMPPDLLRGAYYQELYRERFGARAPALAPAPIDFRGKPGGKMTKDATVEIALREFGDCVVRRDLSDAQALILSLPGDPQETDALAALMPQFNACLVRGSQWTLDRGLISAILSEVVYREAVASNGEAPN
ncbi:MAG TPA: hypothetical protein VGU01_15820 [Sphingomicrobium sp.]|nr:hypothetical protein [Sphingomicrobium sp.]